jgi:hypothetical protein
MQTFRFLGDWVSEEDQFGKMFRSLFQVKLFWPPGVELASRLICRSAGFMKVCLRDDWDRRKTDKDIDTKKWILGT